MLQGWCLYIFWKAVHSLFADNIEGCAMNVVAKTPLVSPQTNENSGKLPEFTPTSDPGYSAAERCGRIQFWRGKWQV